MKLAAIVTVYRKYSHAQHIVDRMLEGYRWNRVRSQDLPPVEPAPFPPPSPLKIAPLCSTGSRVLWRSPTPLRRACPLYGVTPFRTDLDSGRVEKPPRSPGSRACCFSACAGSQTTQGQLAARDSATSRVAFPVGETVGVPGSIPFRSSIARPSDALIYASTDTSRCPSQDSGSRWSSLSPFL